MHQLRLYVERVVRPIRASGHRKDRMREELLAHLTTTYREELERNGDEAAALARTLQRFGDPRKVRLELQASVPLLERVLCVHLPYAKRYAAIERRACKWRPAESGLRYAVRVTCATAILWGVFLLPVTALAVVAALVRQRPIRPIVGWELHFLGAVIGSLLFGWFFGSPLH